MLQSEEFRAYGPPGTGKTTWVAKHARIAVDKFGGDQVSICSLTNTAVREVIGRDLPVDPDNVTTLHARCKRALSAPAPAETIAGEFAKAFPNRATEECIPRSLVGKLGGEEEEPESVDETVLSGGQATLYEQANILRQQMVPVGRWPIKVQRWYQVWKRWCDDTGRYDFTGWLETALEVHPLPAQQVVFVDEAQDHTPLQLAVLRSWAARKLILVGDDDQSLYEWTGADPTRFINPPLEGREIVLSQSYRVPRAVHGVAMQMVRGIRQRKEKAYAPTGVEGEVLRSSYSLSRAKEGLLPPCVGEGRGSVMLLASCGYLLADVIELLKAEGIAFHNPYRRSNLRWNPLASIGPTLRGFLRRDQIWTGAEAYAWASALKAEGVFQRGLKEKFLTVCKLRGVEQLGITDLTDHFEPDVLNRLMRRDLGVFAEYKRMGLLGNWTYALKVFRRPESEWDPQVIVGTIHSVKGGEADNVIVFPDLSAAGFGDYQAGGQDRIRRLMYVAFTRSKRTLVLCDQSKWQAVKW
jgi:superfamily I DNA/RNA helicase